ncbi:MAG: hypothetical protein AAFQ57_05460 [Cyanobacteria bacterium J06626_14]
MCIINRGGDRQCCHVIGGRSQKSLALEQEIRIAVMMTEMKQGTI